MKKSSPFVLSAALAFLISTLLLPAMVRAEEDKKAVLAEAEVSPELQSKMESDPLLQEGPVRFVDSRSGLELVWDKNKVSLQADQALFDEMRKRYERDQSTGPQSGSLPSSPQSTGEWNQFVGDKEKEVMAEAGLGELNQIVGKLSTDLTATLQSGDARREDARDGVEKRFRVDLIKNPTRNLEAGKDGREGLGNGDGLGENAKEATLKEKSGVGSDYGKDNPANDENSSGFFGKIANAFVSLINNIGKAGTALADASDRAKGPTSTTYLYKDGKLATIIDEGPAHKQVITIGPDGGTTSVTGSGDPRWMDLSDVVISLSKDENPQESYLSAKDRGMAIVEAAAASGAGEKSPNTIGWKSPGGVKPLSPAGAASISGADGTDPVKLDPAVVENTTLRSKQFWKSPGGQNPRKR